MCIACKNNNYVDTDNKCVDLTGDPISGCEFYGTSQSQCLICENGYYLDDDVVCKKESLVFGANSYCMRKKTGKDGVAYCV